MANWTVTCKNCGQAFALAPISDSLSDFYLPEKPDFPPQGLERKCPLCSAKFNYQSTSSRIRSSKKPKLAAVAEYRTFPASQTGPAPW